MSSPAAEKLATQHNAKVAKSTPGANSDPGSVIKGYADRLQTLVEEKQTIADDIKELKAEAKACGVDPKALVAVVKRRMEDEEQRQKREDHESTVDTYLASLGLLD